jgi:leucyl/phenylalanyl-tRNA--protein transferase
MVQTPSLTPELLLYAYQQGIFPMADPDRGGAIDWYAPDPRAILPLDAFHVPKTLERLVRQERFQVARDRAFEEVMRACADRSSTWITDEIIQAYVALYHLGFAHSVECWKDGSLVGGLYGVALGGAFFGESMFHKERDASKVALVHLVRRLRAQGFVLLDTQFVTPHLARFGAVEIPRSDYERRLRRALQVQAAW